MSTIGPINGMTTRSCHHPERCVSCSRRAPAATVGSSVMANQAQEMTREPIKAERMFAGMPTRAVNRMKYQYSERDALPVGQVPQRGVSADPSGRA